VQTFRKRRAGLSATAGLSCFNFMRIATGRLAGSSPPLTAQTTQPVGVHIPYMVSIFEINIFPIFYPKM